MAESTTDGGGTVLVLGATGRTGRLVTAGLRARGLPVRPAARSGRGTARFDWDDARTWDAAVEGVGAVYVVTPEDPGFDAGKVASFMACAARAGVRRCVLLSGLSAGYGSRPMASRETPVRESPMEWTILRPGAFQQVFGREPYLTALRTGELRLPLGPGPGPYTAPIDVADIADVAVAVLAGGHAGRTYPLSGPRALTYQDIMSIIAGETGRAVTVVDEPVERWTELKRAAGASEAALSWSLETFAAIRRGEYAHLHDGVRLVLGREPRDFTAYARTAAKEGVWV